MLGEQLGVGVIGQRSHRWQTHEALTQPLHTPTFLIDCKQQIWTYPANRGRQLANLARVFASHPSASTIASSVRSARVASSNSVGISGTGRGTGAA